MARPADPRRRDEILAAARALFVERGFAQTRMADVAARAGVAPGTIYLYFTSKEAIIQALGERFYEQLAAVTLPHLQNDDPGAAISAIVRAAFAFNAAERDLLRLARLDSGLAPIARGLPQRRAFHARIGAALAEQMERGAVRRYDPVALAELVGGMIERAAEACLLDSDGDCATYETTLVTMLRYALLAS